MTIHDIDTDESHKLNRKLRVKTRNDSIQQAAMTLAKARKWPSPAAIAEMTGISVSVIDRQKALLLTARRQWVCSNGGPHPQWRDPEANAPPSAPQDASVNLSGEHEKESRRKIVIEQQRVSIRNLKKRIEHLEEQVRRLVLSVRPSELSDLLKAGSPKHRLN